MSTQKQNVPNGQNIYESKEERCIQALKRAKSIHHKYLSKNDYEKLNILPCACTISKVFNGWSNAKKSAGLPTRPARGEYNEKDCIESIRKAYNSLGHAPSIRDYDELGYSPSRKVIKKLFGDWNTAIKSAGFEPNNSKNYYPETKYNPEDCLKSLKEAENKIGKSPTLEEYRNLQIKPSYSIFLKFFGSFNNAKEKIGMKCYNTKNKTRKRNKIDYGRNWKNIRKSVFDMRGENCLVCNISRKKNFEIIGKDLDVHHIIPFNKFKNKEIANQLQNLVPLCSSCHGYIENKTIEEQCEILNIEYNTLPVSSIENK